VDADSAAKIGKLAGVDAVLIGEIVPQRIKDRKKGNEAEMEVTISARLIHTTTGEVLASEVFSYKKKLRIAPREEKIPRDELKKILDEAVEGFVKELIVKIPEKK
jgi:ABC-type uncharacterized transport system auxiliary subunit